jgi:peroxiredoxin
LIARWVFALITFYKTYLRETIILVGYILTSKNEIIPEQNDAKNWNYQNVFKRAGRYPRRYQSIVPSIDTKVCEAQTHYLGEENNCRQMQFV